MTLWSFRERRTNDSFEGIRHAVEFGGLRRAALKARAASINLHAIHQTLRQIVGIKSERDVHVSTSNSRGVLDAAPQTTFAFGAAITVFAPSADIWERARNVVESYAWSKPSECAPTSVERGDALGCSRHRNHVHVVCVQIRLEISLHEDAFGVFAASPRRATSEFFGILHDEQCATGAQNGTWFQRIFPPASSFDHPKRHVHGVAVRITNLDVRLNAILLRV